MRIMIRRLICLLRGHAVILVPVSPYTYRLVCLRCGADTVSLMYRSRRDRKRPTPITAFLANLPSVREISHRYGSPQAEALIAKHGTQHLPTVWGAMSHQETAEALGGIPTSGRVPCPDCSLEGR